MPVCGSVGGKGTSESRMGYHGNIFFENQCGGRRGRGERPDLVGRQGGKESHRQNSNLVHSAEFTL